MTQIRSNKCGCASACSRSSSAFIAALPVGSGRHRAAVAGRAAEHGGAAGRRGRGARPTNEQDAERLAALPLMPAPAPGTQRFLRMREVQDLLAAHGEDMSPLELSAAN